MKSKNSDIISVQFGNTGVRVASGSFSDKRKPLTFIYEPYKDEINFDSKVNALSIAISNLATKATEVQVILESKDVIKREINVPKVEPEDLDDLITYEINETVPINLTDYVIRHSVLGEMEGDENMLNVLVVAIPNFDVEESYAIVKAVGLIPISLDINTNALNNILLAKPDILNGNVAEETESTTVLALDLGYNNSVATIFKNGKFFLSRNLDIGIDVYDFALNEYQDNTQIDDLGISILYSTERVVLESNLNTMDFEIADKINEATEAILSYLEKIINYYLSRSNLNKIDKILIYGYGSVHEDFKMLLQNRFDIKTQCLTVTDLKSSHMAIEVLGGLLPHTQNFYTHLLPVKEKTNYKRLALIALLILFSFYGIYSIGSMFFQIKTLRAENEQIKVLLDSPQYAQGISKIEENQRRKEALQEYITKIDGVYSIMESNNAPVSNWLEYINQQLPNGLFINTLRFTSNQIVISGFAQSSEKVIKFTDRLRDNKDFQNILLPRISEDDGNFAFEININMEPKEPIDPNAEATGATDAETNQENSGGDN